MSSMSRTVLLALALAACAPAAPRTAPEPTPANAAQQARYDRFARTFLDWYYAANPVRSTGLGIHRFDERLPDLTRPAIDRRNAELRRFLAELGTIDRASLSHDAQFDHQILDHALRASCWSGRRCAAGKRTRRTTTAWWRAGWRRSRRASSRPRPAGWSC
jgi:uncharacterized protein (DUF885 family)